jgi:hypothetical protein
MMEGYFLDSNNIFNAMESLYRMSVKSCVKNGITEDALKEYIFNGQDDGSVYRLSFRYNVIERAAIVKRLDGETQQEFNTRCFEQSKKILKQYGVSDTAIANLTFDQAMEALAEAGVVIEDGIMYDKLTHFNNIYAYCKGILAELGYAAPALTTNESTNIQLLEKKVEEIVEQLEKTDAHVFYDDYTMDVYVVNELLISQQRDGKYYVAVSMYDMIIEVNAHHLAFLEWNSKNWYSQYFTWIEIGYMTDLQIIDKNGRDYTFVLDNSGSDTSQGVTTKNLKIFAVNELGERTQIAYTIENHYYSDMGVPEVEYIDALTNFRSFYQLLQYISLRGIIDDKELSIMQDKNGNPMTPEQFRALPDEECDLIIYYRAVDLRGNSVGKVVRFYNYTEVGHAYVTVDVVDAFDKNGNPITDWKSQSTPQDGEGIFYVDSAHLQKLLKATADFADGKLITLS